MKLALTIALLFAALTVAGGQEPTPVIAPLPDGRKPTVDAHVWGALIYATDDTNSIPATAKISAAPPQYADLPGRLGKVFPFKNFAILGQHRQVVFREYESWVVPTKELFLKVDSRGQAPGGGMRLHVQVWREQQVLSKSDTVLRTGSPLFIGGPKWRSGQLIFVLSLQR